MTRVLCLESPKSLRPTGVGQTVRAMQSQNRHPTKEGLISSGRGGRIVVTVSSSKESVEKIRSVRGNYAACEGRVRKLSSATGMTTPPTDANHAYSGDRRLRHDRLLGG